MTINIRLHIWGTAYTVLMILEYIFILVPQPNTSPINSIDVHTCDSCQAINFNSQFQRIESLQNKLHKMSNKVQETS